MAHPTMAHPMMAHEGTRVHAMEEETLPIPGAVFGLALLLVTVVVLFTAGWLGCDLLIPAKPFTY